MKKLTCCAVLVGVVLSAGCGGSKGGGDPEAAGAGAVGSGGTSSGGTNSERGGAEAGGTETGDGGTETGTGGAEPGEGLFIGHEESGLAAIPEEALAAAKSSLHVVYQHTSHGSQLITGMDSLAAFPEYGSTYAWSDAGEGSALDLDDGGIPADVADLSQGDSVDGNGDTPWVVGTRALLDDPANAHVNVVMWSWCSINGHDAQRYVDNMEKLIAEYPSVTFVFMTGHAEGQGEDMSEDGIHYNNELIRRHCREHGRWLYDFADIEAHDPDGNYYWNSGMIDNLDYDGGNWGVEWISANPEHDYAQLTMGTEGFPGTSGCAHSDSPPEANINCVQKAAAAWHLFARLAGWAGPNG